jgi:hypothetical protein
MPQNCSSDVEAVISYLDDMYAASDTAGIQTLKEAFGLGDVVHVEDFATARESLSLSMVSIYYLVILIVFTRTNSSVQPVRLAITAA